jgi:hypothetical protein
LDVISAANYSIQKSTNLAPELNQIIDIACHQFDPTIANPPKQPSFSTPISALSRATAFAAAPSSTSKTYKLLDG